MAAPSLALSSFLSGLALVIFGIVLGSLVRFLWFEAVDQAAIKSQMVGVGC
jgi:hypothetical protein